MVEIGTPDYILFVQHGWHDTNRRVHRLGRTLAGGRAEVVAPNLGLVKTWWRIEPLIGQVERIAIATQHRYPNHPWRIVGHSMGGLIWLELLQRHPEWWPHITSVSLVSSPVGGADLGRIFDPFRWGIGIARDLGTDRRQLAEQLAQHIPIQTIASDYDGGSDGTVPIQCSRFRYGWYTQLSGIRHDNTKDHPDVTAAIQHFWAKVPDLTFPMPPMSPMTPGEGAVQNAAIQDAAIQDALTGDLHIIPGMTDAHLRDFRRAQVWATLINGFTLRTWRHPLGIHHVFLADAQHRCCFAGFVGWPHTRGLYAGLNKIKQRYCAR